MPLPNIAQGQIALDPLNGIFYYRDENNNLVSSSLSWLQDTLSSVSTVDAVTISSDLNVSGDLVIGGDTVSLNVSEVLIEDNILILNANFTGAPILNAGLEIERGDLANVQILWNEADNKWQFTNDGTTYLDLNSIIANSVTLGLHTIGDYVKNLTAGTGVTITDNSGEGATPRISIGQDISTGATPNFARVIAPLTGNVTGNLTGDVTGTVSDLSNHGINDFSDVTITSAADGDFLRYSGSQWINDPVNLATDTIGDYVKNLVQGNGLTVSNNSGEGATPSIAIDTSIVQTRVANITDTEIGYLDGVTSAIQTQIDSKQPTFTGYDYEIHVSQVDGNDTTGNGDLLTPVASITKALTLITGQRRTIVIHPGSYTENPSITTQYTVLTTYEPLGGNTAISGTVSTSVGCTIAGLTMTNLTITAGTGVGVPNIINSNISGTLTKSGNATFTDIHNCDIGTAANITGSGLVTINDGNPNFVTVNNSSANVIIKGAMSCVAPTLTAGTLSLVDSVVAAAATNAVTSAASSVITLANCQFLTSALNNVAPVVLNGFYSILNCVYDKPNSTLVATSGTGGSTNSVDYFQYINADKFITQGGTSSQYVKGDGSLDSVAYAPLATPTFTGTVSGITKSMVGLGDVDNTSDSNKPVSTAQQTALDLKAPLASPSLTGTPIAPTASPGNNSTQIATTAYADAAVAAIIDSAPATLNTLNELADALGDDANFATTTATAIGLKAPLASPTFTGTVSGITKAMVDLGNVDNTSDANKPVSTSQQTALDLKSNSATPTFTGMVTAPYLKVRGIEIDTSGPVDTNVLKYSSALNKYIPGVASTVASLDDLTDVIISAATPNQVLKYDGSNWVNANAPSGTSGSVYLETIGDGSTSTFVLTHGLSTRDLVVSFTETVAPYGSFSTTWEATTLNTITVYFDTPPTSNSVRASIYGSVSGVSYPSLSGSMYSGYHGNGIDTAIEVYHGMTTRDIFVQVRNAVSPYEIYDVAWESTTTDKLTLYFDIAPALDSVYVMVYAALSGVSSTSISGLTDVTLGGLANGDFLRYNGSVWINDPVNLSTDTVGNYVSSLVQGTGITITNNSGEGATPTISVTASTYQPLDGDLTAIAALAGTSGILTKVSPDTWSLDTNSYLTTSTASSTYLTSADAVTYYQPKDADLTAIAALAGTSGLLKKTAADTWILDTNTYITSLTVGQLTNVSAATPSNDEVLAWQSSTSQWVNKTFSASVATLDTVGDVTAPTPSTGEFLKWNGSAWVNSNQVRDNQISYLMDVS